MKVSSHPKKGCRFKCLIAYKKFEARKEYIVIAFGSKWIDGESKCYQLVKSLRDNGGEFEVLNETLERLTKNNYIK